MSEEENDRISIIADAKLDKICRACLSEVFRDYFWLEGFYQGIKLVDIYRNVTSIAINVESSLPNKLCSACYNQLVKFHFFKNKVLESEKILNDSLVLLNKNNYDNSPSPENYIIIYDDTDCNEEEDKDEFKILVENNEFVDSHNIIAENNDTVLDANFKDSEDIKNEINISQTANPKVKRKKRPKPQKIPKNTLKRRKKQKLQKEPCKTCGKLVYTYRINSHMRSHTKEKPFSCEKCGARFSQRCNLNRHVKIHSNVKPFKCNNCGKSFLRPSSLSIHQMTVHNTERNAICFVCGKAFKHQCLLTRHMSTVHKKSDQDTKTEYLCPDCGILYTNKFSFRVHRRKHEKPMVNFCNICRKTYSSKIVLRNHQKVHTGVKDLTCHVCQKKFRFNATLQIHLRIHSGEKPLSCPICNQKFRQRSHVKSHIRSNHSSEKPYKCTYCDKAFKQRCSLTIHTRIHTGEKPYVCDTCQKGFYDCRSMNKHRKEHLNKGGSTPTPIEVVTE